MTITDAYRDIVSSGASPAEAVIVLAAARQADIELAAWEHELRGPDGRFMKAGSAASTAAGVIAHDDPAHPHRTMVTHAQLAEHAAKMKVQTSSDIARMEAKHAEDMHRMMTHVRNSNRRIAEMQEKGEKKSARTKMAVHAAALTAGAVMAGVEYKMGVPDLLTIASALGPQIIQELIDWIKRL